jgi:hypothetical protein
MSVIAEVRGRPVRLLVVDGQSNPFYSRLPFLRAIAEACQRAADTGHPYDAVVGDFNTPSRSIGFDALAAQGYTLASRSARGWRGTFPSLMPVYDIDHVWLAPKIHVRSCTLFNGPSTDHRGQFVRLRMLSGSLQSPTACVLPSTVRDTLHSIGGHSSARFVSVPGTVFRCDLPPHREAEDLHDHEDHQDWWNHVCDVNGPVEAEWRAG